MAGFTFELSEVQETACEVCRKAILVPRIARRHVCNACSTPDLPVITMASLAHRFDSPLAGKE